MNANSGNHKTQLTELAKAVGAILGVPLALFAVVNSIFEQPLISLIVALITAVLVSVWVILSRWISIREIITAWLALAVVILAGFVIWPRTMTVEGFIYDTAHNPVSNENVRLFDRNGRIYETQTNTEGYYQFTDVPSGKYKVQVRTSAVEGETKGILVRLVQQNLTVSEILATASSTSVAAVTPDTPTAAPIPPTSTPVPPSDTPTREPPTSTPEPTPTPTPSVVEYKLLALQTCRKREDKNRYVTAMGADRDWMLRAETSDRLAWEEFTLLDADTGEQLPCLEAFELFGQGEVGIALKTHHGRYVTAMGADRDWVIRAETTELKDWEKFTVVLP